MRFNDPKLAETRQHRIVIGPVVVQMRGDSKNRCFEAIGQHVRDLK